mmetsp:Transcript_18659/g.65180  ORF Transcript_18659/g.65180 Transcript_18659/m.65180 type:complete len:258 (+) Transcript_18659:1796-2569(+)
MCLAAADARPWTRTSTPTTSGASVAAAAATGADAGAAAGALAAAGAAARTAWSSSKLSARNALVLASPSSSLTCQRPDAASCDRSRPSRPLKCCAAAEARPRTRTLSPTWRGRGASPAAASDASGSACCSSGCASSSSSSSSVPSCSTRFWRRIVAVTISLPTATSASVASKSTSQRPGRVGSARRTMPKRPLRLWALTRPTTLTMEPTESSGASAADTAVMATTSDPSHAAPVPSPSARPTSNATHGRAGGRGVWA